MIILSLRSLSQTLNKISREKKQNVFTWAISRRKEKELFGGGGKGGGERKGASLHCNNSLERPAWFGEWQTGGKRWIGRQGVGDVEGARLGEGMRQHNVYTGRGGGAGGELVWKYST